MKYSHQTGLEIAIIGLAGKFPGAKNIDEFWRNLQIGKESISFFTDLDLAAAGVEPEIIKNPRYIKAKGILEDIELFDARFFGFTPREAEIMDPQHRLFLECAWEALENAGYVPGNKYGAIGIYGGSSLNTYLLNNLYPNRYSLESVGTQVITSNDKDFLTTWVSYKLDLHGPSVVIQTACSTSLVAVHLACQSLLSGDCDIALAGGVSVGVPHKEGYFYHEGGILSPDGHCRAFDAKANGTIGGDGTGIVVLRRLAEAMTDGDTIHAVIKGSAINNDGAIKVGYTAPNLDGQAEVIRAAQQMAEIDVETISYIECHGTGTNLGDPIEIAALTKAFRISTQSKGFCAIGSLKTNIGHLDAASGVAGLIKTVLALKQQQIPPSLHFEQPNPKIDFANSPFFVNSNLSKWVANTSLRAGVSSFGIGGTNAHIILEEAPLPQNSSISRPCQLLLLSAKTSSALETISANLIKHLKENPEINLADVAYTLQVGRKYFNHRRIVVCHDLPEATTALSDPNLQKISTNFQEGGKSSNVFLFPGQGTQYVNMGLEIYQVETTFRETIIKCSQFLIPHLELDLEKVLYPENSAAKNTHLLNQTAISQPALFVIEYALAQLWMEWDIYPQAMIGHSLGEYVAACLAGVFSLEDALTLVAVRGRMMQALPNGSMLTVALAEDEISPLLNQELSIAAINNARLCTISGTTTAIDDLEQKLAKLDVNCRRLNTSHAFHSAMMEPILDSFKNLVNQVTLNPPSIPYISNVTGTWITPAQATDPDYWVKHLRHTVRFADGLGELLRQPNQILLEVGPGTTLSSLAKRCLNKNSTQVVLSSLRHPQDRQSDLAFLLNTLGQLWLAGVTIDWSKFYTTEQRHRLPLPTYPFERQYFWIDKNPSQHNLVRSVSERELSQFHPRPNLDKQYVAPKSALEIEIVKIWESLFGITEIGINDDFFELGGHSMMAVSLISQISQKFQVDLPLATLFQSPTIKQLAALIYSRTDSSLWSVVVPINPHGNRPPLFCIHPDGGTVFCYQHLAHYLNPKQPFYGIESIGINPQRESHTNVEQMATHYIQELKNIQSHGPYFLSGWSFGGLIAFEMAQQLTAQGEQIAFLCLIDIYPPAVYAVPEIESEDDDAELVALIGEDLDLCSAEFQQLAPTDRLIYAVEQAKQKNLIPVSVDIAEVRRILMVQWLNTQALKNYTPQYYSGSIVLFTASDRHPAIKQGIDSESSWNQLVKQVETFLMPGNHHSMIQPPHVQSLAQQLQESLDKAQKHQLEISNAQTTEK